MRKLAAFFLILLIATSALAQDRPAKFVEEDVRWALIAEQIRVSLESTHESIKTQTLKNVIVFATLYRDKIDLADQVRLLCNTYEKLDSAKHRRLTLAALQAIGSHRAYDFVLRNATKAEFEEGRLVVASVLNDYYLSRNDTTPG